MKNLLDIRNEEILLIGLSRLTFNIELKVMLRALAEEITDWPYFCSLANKHGIAALTYKNLNDLGFIELLQPGDVEFLRNKLMQNIRRNTIYTASTLEALKILQDEDIKVVLLKGMALELTAYGNEGLRQMSDVDVLVDRKNCIKAWNILQKYGFTSLPVKSVFHRLIIADTGKHLPSLIKGTFQFELHHELFGGRKNNLTKMVYEDSNVFIVNNMPTNIPAPQILFLYLVKHLYQHETRGESQLRLYADLVVLIEKYRDEIINYKLLDLSLEAGLKDILAWKLEPLRDLWGISFPGWLNDFINKNYNPDSINKFIYFLKSPKNNPPENNASVYRSIVKEIPGFHRKVIFVLGDLFPTLDFMKKRYKCNSLFRALLFYPHRLGKLWYLIRS